MLAPWKKGAAMLRITLKQGVELTAAHFLVPEVARIVGVAASTAPEEDMPELVITSGLDGTHKKGSLHYACKAFDFRTFSIDAPTAAVREEKIQAWAQRMRSELGPDYDVIVETSHIHAEWDPGSNSTPRYARLHDHAKVDVIRPRRNRE